MYFASEDYTFQSDISSSDEDVGRVVRGTEAKVGQFPHQLLLTRSGASPCGAVLITSILALTAAHCVNERLPSQLTIESARHLRSHDDKFVQKVGVKSVMIHEQFHYTGGAAHNDIAILLLSQEVNFNAYVYPIYVPTTKTRFEETAQVSGWGRTSENGSTSNPLMFAVVDIYTLERCREIYKPRNLHVGDNMMCALGKNGEDACNMDSGGPLKCKGLDGRHYVCGIVSWGDGCGRYPGVYTDVAKMSEWIKGKIANYKPASLCPLHLRCCTINIDPIIPQNSANKVTTNPVSSSSSVGRSADETSSEGSLCDDEEFYCSSSDQCIHKMYLCDGTVECPDISLDRVGCEQDGRIETQENPCRGNDIYCASSNQCFPSEHYSYDEVCPDNTDGRTGDEGNVKSSDDSGPCHVGDFHCEQSNLCIANTLRCNGNFDCNLGEDEAGCDGDHDVGRSADISERQDPVYCASDDWECIVGWNPPETETNDGRTGGGSCGVNSFQCAYSNLCIPMGNRCNGQYDCEDGDYSDEADCPDYVDETSIDSTQDTAVGSASCNAGDFLCAKSVFCISGTLRCNGNYDCGEGDTTDEDGCDGRSADNELEDSSCDEDHFYCDIWSQCLPHGYQCGSDGDSRSGDQNVETGFTHDHVDNDVQRNTDYDDYDPQQSRPQKVCREDQFNCNNNQCIPGTYECDGESDCQDGSDEHESCT